MITGGGLSSFAVTVNLVLVDAEPATFTAEQIITVPESCTLEHTIYSNISISINTARLFLRFPKILKITQKANLLRQDNHQKHTSNCVKITNNKESKKVLEIMEWPPQSSYLKMIELLWDELNRHRQKIVVTNANQLYDVFE